MKELKLSDVVERFATGLNPRRNFVLNSGGTYKYITIKNIKKGKLVNLKSCDLVDEKALQMINKRSDLRPGDVLLTSIGATGDTYIVKEKPDTWNINESVFSIRGKKDLIKPEYLSYILSSPSAIRYYEQNQTGSTFKSIKLKQLKEMPVSICSLEDQDKIIEIIKTINKIKELKYNQIDIVNNSILSIFDETLKNNKCDSIELGELLKYEQPTKYIVADDKYDDKNPTPVLTAGKTFILGYTAEKNNIFPGSKESVIIFDDFTTSTKYVNFDFKVKSSAMKILHNNPAESNILYLYYSIKNLDFAPSVHKRYWISEFSKKKIMVPDVDVQNNFANKIYLLNETVERLKNDIANLDELIDSVFHYYTK